MAIEIEWKRLNESHNDGNWDWMKERLREVILTKSIILTCFVIIENEASSFSLK